MTSLAPHDLAPKSSAAFAELLSALRECVELTTATAADEHDAAEGYRWALHFLLSSVGQFFENDPERPRFVPMITPTMGQPWAAYATPIEIWAPNPYTTYDWAPLAQGHSYRIRGTRGAVRYIGVALYSGTDWNGLMPLRIGDALNMTNLMCEPDGSFEIVIAAERPAEARNFLEIDPDVHSVLVRQFFADPAEEPARYMIERIDQPGPSPRPTDESTEHRLRSLVTFLHETGIDFLKAFGRPSPVLPAVINKFDLASLDDQASENWPRCSRWHRLHVHQPGPLVPVL